MLQAGIDLFEPLAQVSTQASSTQLHLLHAPESLSRYLEPNGYGLSDFHTPAWTRRFFFWPLPMLERLQDPSGC